LTIPIVLLLKSFFSDILLHNRKKPRLRAPSQACFRVISAAKLDLVMYEMCFKLELAHSTAQPMYQLKFL